MNLIKSGSSLISCNNNKETPMSDKITTAPTSSSYSTLCKSSRLIEHIQNRKKKKVLDGANEHSNKNKTEGEKETPECIIRIDGNTGFTSLTMDINKSWASDVHVSMSEGYWIIDATDKRNTSITFKSRIYGDLIVYSNTIVQKRSILYIDNHNKSKTKIVEEIVADFRYKSKNNNVEDNDSTRS